MYRLLLNMMKSKYKCYLHQLLVSTTIQYYYAAIMLLISVLYNRARCGNVEENWIFQKVW